MNYSIKELWDKVCCYLIKSKNKTASEDQDDELIKQALEEINQAWILFSAVEDLDLIDYAIYSINAAEKKYTYLVKRLKRKEASKYFSVERSLCQ